MTSKESNLLWAKAIHAECKKIEDEKAMREARLAIDGPEAVRLLRALVGNGPSSEYAKAFKEAEAFLKGLPHE